jgi:hypothetical protein
MPGQHGRQGRRPGIRVDLGSCLVLEAESNGGGDGRREVESVAAPVTATAEERTTTVLR